MPPRFAFLGYLLAFGLLLRLIWWNSGSNRPHLLSQSPFASERLRSIFEEKPRAGRQHDYLERRERIRDAFTVSWEAYKEDAWGR